MTNKDTIFKIKPPLPMDNDLESICTRLNYLQERLEFFKKDKNIREGLEITYTKEIAILRIHQRTDKNLEYLKWFTNYLGWRKI